MTSGKTKFQTYNHPGKVHSHRLKRNPSETIGIEIYWNYKLQQNPRSKASNKLPLSSVPPGSKETELIVIQDFCSKCESRDTNGE